MAKKEFKWKETQQIGVVDINEKKRVMVQFNSLDIEKEDETEERWYVSLTTMQNYKRKGNDDVTWNITKNATFPMDAWLEISDLIAENLEDEE